MTRDEFENKLELILDSDTGADCTVVFDELLVHDAKQRRVIEQQAQQIFTLKSELSQRTNLEGSAPCWNSAHMKQIATLREALNGIVTNIDEMSDRSLLLVQTRSAAQQALKEVTP